jgi:hypothetical protein
MGPDELKELLAAAGIELEFNPIETMKAHEAFQGTAQASISPGAKLFGLEGKMKSGETLRALIVLEPAKKF